MKSKLLFTILLLSACSTFSFAQQQFNYFYANSIGASDNVYSNIQLCPDNSIIGTNYGDTAGTYTLFKMDIDGNMIWRKRVTVDNLGIVTPYELVLLRDSAVAVVTEMFMTNGFLAAKFDLDGNLLWQKKFLTSAFGVTEGTSLSNGGMVVGMTSRLVFIRPDGTVDTMLHVNNSGLNDLYFWELENIGNDVIRVVGTRNNPTEIFAFDIDSLGNVSNNYRYAFGTNAVDPQSMVPYEMMSISPSGGTYCMITMNANPTNGYGIFYLDPQNLPVWSRKVNQTVNPRILRSSVDNGCIATAYSTSVGTWPLLVTKFDSTGTMQWMKYPGNNSIPAFAFGEIYSMARDTGSGWYNVMSCANLHVTHTDSAFNGFCSYQSGSSTVTPMVITADTIDIHVGGFSVADSLITTQVFNRPWYQYNSCTGQIIDTLTSLPHLTLLAPGIHVFPNPAQEKITITFTEPFMDGTLTLYDIHGNKVREEKPETQLSLDWNLNELRSGIYVLCFRTGTGVYSQRILKID